MIKTTKTVFHIVFTAFLMFAVLTGCQHKKAENDSIRFASFLLPPQNVKLTIEGPESEEVVLKYGQPTHYRKLPEGKYSFTVRDMNDALIIKKKMGIGTGSKYTMVSSGIIPKKTKGKVKTLKTKLLETFEGATAGPANAGMPVMEVLLDRFEGSSSEAKLKVVHMGPALSALDIYIEKKGKMKKLSTVAYPKPSSRNYALKPGTYPVEIRFKASSAILYSGDVTLQPAELTTLFVFGKQSAYPHTLEAVQVQNK